LTIYSELEIARFKNPQMSLFGFSTALFRIQKRFGANYTTKVDNSTDLLNIIRKAFKNFNDISAAQEKARSILIELLMLPEFENMSLYYFHAQISKDSLTKSHGAIKNQVCYNSSTVCSLFNYHTYGCNS
jgi:hypothetical protein